MHNNEKESQTFDCLILGLVGSCDVLCMLAESAVCCLLSVNDLSASDFHRALLI